MKKNSGKKANDAAKQPKVPAAPAPKVKDFHPPAASQPLATATSTPLPAAKSAKSPKTSRKGKSKTAGTGNSTSISSAPEPLQTKASIAVTPSERVEIKNAPVQDPSAADKTPPSNRNFSEPTVSLTPGPALPGSPTEVPNLSADLPGSSSFAAPASSAPTKVPTAGKAEPNTKPGKRPARAADAARAEVKIPSILLEGDLPPGPPVSGPGARYALAPQPILHPAPSSSGELPEAYGTGRVFLAARDPHWLYVSWDFTAEQQARFNAQSRDRHLIIRILANEQASAVPEVHVHPESKNWFVHVPFAETLYSAEIGFYDAEGAWHRAAVSHQTLTPPDAPSNDISAEFATIPLEVSFQQVVKAVQQFVTISKSEPLLEAVASASEAQREHLPPPSSRSVEPALPQSSKTRIGPAASPAEQQSRSRAAAPIPIQINPADDWSEEQAEALRTLIHMDSFRRVWMGSMEITELVRRYLEEEVASISAARRKKPSQSEEGRAPLDEANISSPAGGEFSKPSRFWFKVNAELIIYGATEADATVTIAERPAKLRPDGTFSFRFSLPDGRYQLPAIARSADGEHGREVRLEFSRSSDYRGQVEAHPQDAALRPPRPENLE